MIPVGKWIDCEKELPPENGSYEITNHPEAEDDSMRREMTTTAWYDGYGFQWGGVYRDPRFWRHYERLEKRYGKIED